MAATPSLLGHDRSGRPFGRVYRVARERRLRFWRALSFALSARIRGVWARAPGVVVPTYSDGVEEELVAGSYG